MPPFLLFGVLMEEINDTNLISAAPGRMLMELYDWGEALVFALTFVVLTFTFIFRIITVDGSSMLPTLHDKDKIIISNILYKPKQGDIVVLTKKEFSSQPLVKRIIAVEGQTIDINFTTHEVIVDGKVLDEPYINEPTSLSYDMTFPAVVPKNCIFVMGDNRNRSTDSRKITIGMIDKRNVLGKAEFFLYTFDKFGPVKNDWVG
jgi:signal peptidase I